MPESKRPRRRRRSLDEQLARTEAKARNKARRTEASYTRGDRTVRLVREPVTPPPAPSPQAVHLPPPAPVAVTEQVGRARRLARGRLLPLSAGLAVGGTVGAGAYAAGRRSRARKSWEGPGMELYDPFTGEVVVAKAKVALPVPRSTSVAPRLPRRRFEALTQHGGRRRIGPSHRLERYGKSLFYDLGGGGRVGRRLPTGSLDQRAMR